MTVVDAEAPTTGDSARPDPTRSPTWAARGGALALDILPGAALLATAALVALSVPLRSTFWWVCVSIGAVAALSTAFNRLVLPAITGQSLGRAVFGITIVRRDGAAVGAWWLLLRDVAHLLDTAAVFVGWLWPLWDPRRRTFADVLLRTESRPLQPRWPQTQLRRSTAAVVLSVAALCVGGAAISYFGVHHHDRSIAEVRRQIAEQGPRMVEQILSYHPETMQGDFDRARSLVTDNYQQQLIAQQEAVKKAGAVRNEYWTTNSSVLSATSGRATMLVFLQGQRGAPPEQRYITASVRATFVKSGSAGWRVDDVAVVTKPQPAAEGP
ncbi:RDD family protein [Mycolicibacterium sp. jd]|uniref:RDD family protein n=1 Tax=Mycolicibacterium austroafricanum TaxID=39687 RepID=A0ABT8HM89_MYCAO|nr:MULTISPECIES: RDD family protein [Mycolicibacterium]MDN4521849.1 RDD family protein [Mycolicibacterium austroafricanum]UJL30597.1 RDD family protein [Mycolicibacterium vanbaalenii]WND56297.1 RDD family protein [Mycolicibacterium vanbaalenii]